MIPLLAALLTFDAFNIPTLAIQIENQTLPLILDLGSHYPLMLDKSYLDKLTKKAHGISLWFDVWGNEYTSHTYLIPSISLDDLSWTNVLVRDQPQEWIANTTFSSLSAPIIGSIGRPILEQTNLLLDFPGSAIYPCSTPPSNWHPVPFTLTPDGIAIQVETDIGPTTLILDTGSTWTVLNSSLITTPRTSKFSINNKDFGPQSLLLLEITPKFQTMNGLLGMDFLRQHAIYIDYPNKTIYIKN